jgi:hypothetical protein
LMRRINRSAIRRPDSEAVGRAGSGRVSFSAWLSSVGYAARGERGEPRGRKSGDGSGAGNSR